MASIPPDRKRKRGRPPGASGAAQDASDRNTAAAEPQDAEEEPRPRKRGRKVTQTPDSTAQPPRNQSVTEKPARRGRPPKSREQHTAEQEEVVEERAGARARKKPESLEGKGAPSPENRRPARQRRGGKPDEKPGARRPRQSPRHNASPPSNAASGRTKRAKPASDPVSSTPSRSTRKRRVRDSSRASVSGASDVQAGTPAKVARASKRASMNQDSAEKRRRGRPSTSETGSPKDRPPQKRKSNKTAENEPVSASDHAGGEMQPKRRGRPRAGDAAQEYSSELRRSPGNQARRDAQPAAVRGDQDRVAVKRKKKGTVPRVTEPEVEDASSESEDEQQLPFRHLQEITRDIPRSTFEKWNTLDAASINAVNAFLADAQRPVLLRLQDTNRRREHASAALGQISRRVRTKLTKGLPFPPPTGGLSTRANAGSYEDEFDFERTVDAVEAMEHTLNPLLHSIGLLEKEIGREESALAKEYEALHQLETNARAKAKEWRSKGKRAHILAPGIPTTGERGGRNAIERLELVSGSDDDIVGGLFKDLEDEELVSLSKQVRSHMESMRGNLQQIGGVVPAINKSRAALQQVLLKHLDDGQLERILLG